MLSDLGSSSLPIIILAIIAVALMWKFVLRLIIGAVFVLLALGVMQVLNLFCSC